MSKKLAESFNNVANEYDKYRSEYPDIIFDTILSKLSLKPENISAFEIGAGSGQATQSLIKKNLSIKVLEPSSNLIEIAKNKFKNYKTITFVNKTFEDYIEDSSQRDIFDLVYAAQSFHWVKKDKAYKYVSKILKKNGLFAAFWKRSIPLENEVLDKLSLVYEKYINGFKPICLNQYENIVLNDLSELVDSKLFYKSELLRFKTESKERDTENYINGLKTWSMVAALSDEKREKLFDEVSLLLKDYDNKVPGSENEITMVLGKRI